MMKGTIQAGFGEPREVLSIGEVDTPAVDDDGVLVQVRAASIHIGAVYGVRGLPKVMRPMFKSFIAESGVIGQNIAGVVEAVGKDVTQVSVGDEVFGSCKGAFAEYAATTSEAVAPKPTNSTFEQASAIGVSAFTALQGLRDYGNLQEGQHVLITGASGGVGTFAVQIAKAMGAEVTGVCSTRNVDLVRSIGADHVIDYTQEDFTKGEPQYDLILDNVGAHSLQDMRSVLTPDGLLLANGAAAPTGWFGGLGHPLKVTVSSVFSKQQGRAFLSRENKEDLDTLRELVATGKITPVIDRVFPFEEAVEAVAFVGEGHNQGTSVIAM
ncbi:MAG: NAD(P)-dependent alcohol dehydrogenase [Acidimicrobiia bacterium]|nr:NAD(P)-dependent alcohol dehydrogenase [Acidimicrobiia bacterium]